MDLVKGIITYLKPSRTGTSTKFRLGVRTWCLIRSVLPREYFAASVSCKGKWTNSTRQKCFVVNDVQVITPSSREKTLNKVMTIVEKADIKLTRDALDGAVGHILSVLHVIGKKSLIVKFLKWPDSRKNKYLANPFLFYQNGHLDWHTAEVISEHTGCPFDLKDKVLPLCLHTLEEAYKNGSESLSLTELKEKVDEYFGEDTVAVLGEALKNGKIILHSDRVYLSWLYFLREKALRALSRIVSYDTSLYSSIFEGDPDREKIEKLLKSPYTILTGTAGTGKTTLLRKLSRLPLKIVFSATTGKAAKVLGEDASTVHHLLGYGPKGFTVKKLDCDILIVDEASMLDWRTLNAILTASPRVIFAGDPGQLPPIEGESVFGKMLEVLPSINLEYSWRFNGLDSNVEVIKRNSSKEILSTALALSATLRRKKVNFQGLTPVNNGPLGVNNLNLRLQSLLNGYSKPVGSGIFKLGDKVIVNRNVYVDGILLASNGQVGVVEGYESGMVWVNTGSRVLLEESDLGLAYALTVHKCQGSEYDYVIFVVPPEVSSEFLTDKLLFVGKTRGKVKTYVVVGA